MVSKLYCHLDRSASGFPGTLQLETTACAAFSKESRMKFANATKKIRGSRLERSAVFLYPSRVLAAVDYPGFHHEGNSFEYADVVEGIAGYGDDVGIVAGLERA
jgi:hypothetical protein